MERKIKGIWIPIELFECINLNWNERIVLMLIESFTANKKDCFISNDYISKLLNVSDVQSSRIVSSLIKKGYVKVDSFDGRRRNLKSCLSNFIDSDLSKSSTQSNQKCKGSINENDKAESSEMIEQPYQNEISLNINDKAALSNCKGSLITNVNVLNKITNKDNIREEERENTPPDSNHFFSIEECREKLLVDVSWIEQVTMNTRLSGTSHFTMENLKIYLSEFFRTLQNAGVTKKTVIDSKCHFSRWLNIELKKNIPKSNSVNGRESVKTKDFDKF